MGGGLVLLVWQLLSVSLLVLFENTAVEGVSIFKTSKHKVQDETQVQAQQEPLLDALTLTSGKVSREAVCQFCSSECQVGQQGACYVEQSQHSRQSIPEISQELGDN